MTCVRTFTYFLFIVILQCTNSFFVTRYVPSTDCTILHKVTVPDTLGSHHTLIDKQPMVPVLGSFGNIKLRYPQRPYFKPKAFYVNKTAVGSKYQYTNKSTSTEQYKVAYKTVRYTYVPPVKVSDGNTTTARTTNSSVDKSLRADGGAGNNSRRWWFDNNYFDNITSGDAFTGKYIVAKCYSCNQHDTDVPKDGGMCHKTFESEDWRWRTKGRYFRAHCYYNLDRDGYKKQEYTWRDTRTYKTDKGLKIALAGKYAGGCYKRYLDVGEVHTSRGCRKYGPHPNTRMLTEHRFLRLELLLEGKREGCVFSPSYASLSPFTRPSSLYTRYHVCVCSGRYCNEATTNNSCMFLIYFIVVLFIFL